MKHLNEIDNEIILKGNPPLVFKRQNVEGRVLFTAKLPDVYERRIENRRGFWYNILRPFLPN